MHKTHPRSPDSRRASVVTAQSLTDEQQDKAVAALIAGVLNSIDRTVEAAANGQHASASAPTNAAEAPRRGDIANS